MGCVQKYIGITNVYPGSLYLLTSANKSTQSRVICTSERSPESFRAAANVSVNWTHPVAVLRSTNWQQMFCPGSLYLMTSANRSSVADLAFSLDPCSCWRSSLGIGSNVHLNAALGYVQKCKLLANGLSRISAPTGAGIQDKTFAVIFALRNAD